MTAHKPGGGGSGLDVTTDLTTKLTTTAQTLNNATWTPLVMAIDGSDPIGITKPDGSAVGAGTTNLRFPAGWYVIAVNLYWAASAVGLRGVALTGLGTWGGGNAYLSSGAIVTAAEYAILEAATGLTLNQTFPVTVSDADTAQLTITAYQSSGGGLAVFQGWSALLTKVS